MSNSKLIIQAFTITPYRVSAFRASLVFTFCCCIFQGQDLPGSNKQVTDGVLIYPDHQLSGNAQVVKLQVMADDIIRALHHRLRS